MRLRTLAPHRAAAVLLERKHMGALGVSATARIGRARSRRRWGPRLGHRRDRVAAHLAELESERRRAGREGETLTLSDGWARDDSRSLPHLFELVDEMEGVIAERGLEDWEQHGKPFLKDILPERSWERYRSILDFASSPEVLEPLARYAGFVPPLSGSIPPGVRLMESSTRFDPQPQGPWRSSQLWHLDYHAFPTVYVIVAIREIGPEDGPLHFLGEAASTRVARELGYNGRGAPHRVSDEVMRGHVDRSEVRVFTGPPGSVMFLDSSRCFHFGSRNPANPRYQVQYAYLSPVRNDFSELIRPQISYPVSESDPLSRRLALDRELLDDA